MTKVAAFAPIDTTDLVPMAALYEDEQLYVRLDEGEVELILETCSTQVEVHLTGWQARKLVSTLRQLAGGAVV